MPQTRPVISVVIGVLNGAELIEKAIDSFSAQTLRDKELVVLDGGSTDGTVEVLRRRSAELAYWRSEPDKGLYDAWNKAIDHCRGAYIGFIGCDDEFADPDALARLARAADQTPPPDLICSINALVDGRGRFLKAIGAPWDRPGMRRSMNLAHSCLLHRAELFQTHGGFATDYRVGADYEFFLRLGPETRAAFVEQITMRVGGDGMSHRLWQTRLREHFRAQAKSPDIGLRVATMNLAGNTARFAYRKLRGRR